MNGRSRWLLWAAMALAALSGLTYAFMRYLLEPSDPFSAYGHPLQPHALSLHVLAAPLLLFCVGIAFGAHALPAKRGGERQARRTGLTLIVLVTPMALSGYGLQVFAAASWRPWLAWFHGLSSLVFVGSLVGHALVLWWARRGLTVPEGNRIVVAHDRGSARGLTTPLVAAEVARPAAAARSRAASSEKGP